MKAEELMDRIKSKAGREVKKLVDSLQQWITLPSELDLELPEGTELAQEVEIKKEMKTEISSVIHKWVRALQKKEKVQKDIRKSDPV